MNAKMTAELIEKAMTLPKTRNGKKLFIIELKIGSMIWAKAPIMHKVNPIYGTSLETEIRRMKKYYNDGDINQVEIINAFQA